MTKKKISIKFQIKLFLYCTLPVYPPLRNCVEEKSFELKLKINFFFTTLGLIASIENTKQNIRENIALLANPFPTLLLIH